MKIWYLFCLLFYIYCILILINEKYDVTYLIESNDNLKPIQFLSCLNFYEIFGKQKQIKLNELNKLIFYYFRNFKIPKNLPKLYTIELFKRNQNLILKNIKLNNYILFNKLICLITNSSQDIIAYFVRAPRYFVLYNDSFFELDHFYSRVIRLVVLNLEYPFSKCKLNSNSKFNCLHNCIKQKQKLSKYYYTPSDNNGTIYLNYEENDEILNNEQNCIKKCNYINEKCKLVHFRKKHHRESSENVYQLNSTTIIFRATQSIDDLNYILQFIGLLLLFLNTSIYQLIMKLLSILNMNLKLKNSLFKLKNLLLFLLIMILSKIMIDEYLDRRDNNIIRKEITTNFIKLDNNLVICISLFRLFKNSQLKNFDNKSLEEIERLSDKEMKKELIDIYLEFNERKIKINWNLIKSKIFFWNLNRCFQIQIDQIRSKFKYLLPLTRLSIDTKVNQFSLFILSDRDNLNYKSFKLEKNFNFMKIIIRRSKLNRKIKCLDYFRSNLLNCINRFDCIEKCTVKRFIKKFNMSHFSFVINKDQFTNDQWSKIKFLFQSTEHYDNEYRKIRIDCENKYTRLDCTQVEFKIGVQISNRKHLKTKQIKLDLLIEIIAKLEEEPSLLKLLFDLLNIEIIILGINGFKIINRLFRSIKFNYQNYLIYLLCLIGFLYHLWFIFDAIINGEMIYSQYYKESKSFKMLDLIFCFMSNDLIDYKSKDYLNQRINSVFDTIHYLNQSNHWTILDRYTNFNDNYLRIDLFNILNNECFKLNFNFNNKLKYSKDQFQFSETMNVVKIYFNRSLIHETMISINFLTKLNMEFSKITNLVFKDNEFDFINLITQEQYQIEFFDKFNFIRQLIHKKIDADEYLNKMINNFERDKIKKKSNLNEIDEIDELFEEFINKLENDTNIMQLNPNKKHFKINHLDQKLHENFYSPDYEFRIQFFKRIIRINNQTNFTRLIIDCLNALSFWFSKSILDVYKLKLLLIKLLMYIVE